MEEFTVYVTEEHSGRVVPVTVRARDRQDAISKAQAQIIGGTGEFADLDVQLSGRLVFDAIARASAGTEITPARNNPNIAPPATTPRVDVDSFSEDLGEEATRADIIDSLSRGVGTQVNNLAPAVEQVAFERYGSGSNLLGNLLRGRTDSFNDLFSGLTNVDNDAEIPGGGPLGFVRQTGIGDFGELARRNVRGYLNEPDNFDFNNALENAIEVAGSVSGNLRRSIIQNSERIGGAFTRAGIDGLSETDSFRQALREVAPGLLDLVGAR